MPLQEDIQKIIDRRKGLGEYEGKGRLAKIEPKLSYFRKLKESVKSFEEFRQVLISQESSKSGEYYTFFREDPTLIDKIRQASADTVLEKLDGCVAECERLYERFNRDAINISVVGRARQGKSLLLQTVSGLSDAIIPSADGGHCTGTTSIICNDPNCEVTHAEVYFYTADEILKQVQDYLDKIGINRRLHHFNEITQLESTIAEYNANDKALKRTLSAQKQSYFDHLEKYVTHFNQYCDLVAEIKHDISEAQIRFYVAQYDLNGNYIYNYLAVKEVRIYTRFHNPEVGKVVLVDTIGLGDTALGIEKRMLQTLRNNSDSAFMIRLPNHTGDSWCKEDNDLYDLIEGEMGTTMMDKWLSLALNTSVSLGNENAYNAVMDTIPSTLHLHDIIRVDCASRDEVYDKLLVPALAYLSENLDKIDNDLIEDANKLFKECYRSYVSLYDLVADIVSSSPQFVALGDNFAINKWDQIWPDITADLGKLFLDYNDQQHNPSPDIYKAIANKREDLYQFMPDESWYLNELTKMGPQDTYEGVYQRGLNILRTNISASFEDINVNVLEPMQEQLKERIAEVLYNTGKWSQLLLKEESSEECTLEWLEAFADEKLKAYPLVQSAVRFILSYMMSISDLLDYEVESSLGIITPNHYQYEPLDLQQARSRGLDATLPSMAGFIFNSTMNLIPLVKKSLESEFNLLTTIPNHSLYARIRKFREKLVMTVDAERELRDFYISNARTIWSQDFINMAKTAGAVARFNKWLEMLPMSKKTQSEFMIKIKEQKDGTD